MASQSDEYQFLFVGNRRFVLEEMLASGLEISGILVISGSHLERDIEAGLLGELPNIHKILDKPSLVQHLQDIEFDILVSNGCPYILPLDELPRSRYVNIHPSFLPDLKGVDPVIGAVLLQRDSGATCHIIDQGIDTGDIISQVRIPYSEDLDVVTLYQLSFIAEREAFKEALIKDFKAAHVQTDSGEYVEYKRNLVDQWISFDESNQLMIQKIRAYNNRSIGCQFEACGGRFRVFDAEYVLNSYAREKVFQAPAGTIVFSYEGNVIFQKDGDVIRFKAVTSEDGEMLRVGDRLFVK